VLVIYIFKDGAEEVMNHKWFKNLNWNGILNKKIKAPYIPKIKDELDVSNFDKVFLYIK